MPRTKEQNDIVKTQRRQSILQSSFILYALYGDKVTIDQISNKSKCSHGIVYHYFKNVDEIIDSLFKSPELNALKNELMVLLDMDKPLESIAASIRKLTSLKNNNEFAIAHILLKEEGKNSLKERFSNLIEKGQEQHLFVAGEAKDIIAVLFSFLDGLYLQALLHKRNSLPLISIDNILNIVIKH